MKESELQTQVLRLLRIKGIFHWRMALGGIPHKIAGKIIYKKNALKGFPDLCGVFPGGIMWAIELKSAKGILSIEQKYWIANLKSNGVRVAVCRSLEEVINFITQNLKDLKT